MDGTDRPGTRHSLWERSALGCLLGAHWLEKYLVQRGGRCKPGDIEAPKVEWPSNPVDPHKPLTDVITLEKRRFEDQERLCNLAKSKGNPSLSEIVEARFLRRESRHVKDLVDLLKQANRVSKDPGHGLFHLDRELRAREGAFPWDRANDPEDIGACMKAIACTFERKEDIDIAIRALANMIDRKL
jgi:ferritin heavy chain